jgi:hypothetical protein
LYSGPPCWQAKKCFQHACTDPITLNSISGLRLMYDSFGLLNVGQELPSAPMIGSGSSRRHHLQLKAIRGLKAIWIEADQTFPPPYRNPADLLLHGVRHLVAAGFPLHRIALALVPIETGQGGIQYWWDVENPEEVHSFFLGSEFFAGMDHRTSILHAVCEGKVLSACVLSISSPRIYLMH